MKKSVFLFFVWVLLISVLVGCNQPSTNPSTDAGENTYDPTPFVALTNPGEGESQGQIVGTLVNDSDVDLAVGGIFILTQGTTTVGTGQMGSATVGKHSSAALIFDISHLVLADGEYTFNITYSWINGTGTTSSKDISMNYTLARASVDGPGPNRDVTVTPIGDLTESEGDELAQYLFETYIPYCFGIFENTAELSSSTLWPSIYALNAAVDGDTSETTLTKTDAIKKAARYFPGANFVPEEIRMFNKLTQTFQPAPAPEQNYTFLSYEINGEQITVYYEDIPEDVDQTPGQYATTLVNCSEEGYFSFISTTRISAVG